MKKPYFKRGENDPAPLSGTVTSKVRFQEVDSLGIAWHGHFSSYFEDARVAMGEAYNIGYMDFYNNGILAPIKTLHIDYRHPLKFQEEITIEGRLHYTEAARINNEFIIRNSQGITAATGFTVQMLLDRDYQLFMIQPEFYKNFCDRWKAGNL